MKRSALVIAIVLVLPLILAACGGGATGNAEDFIKAMADHDVKKAKDVSCSAFASTIDLLAEGTSEDSKAEDIKCEKDGDTKVKCDFKADGESTSLTFIVDKDDKICGIDGFGNIDDIEIPDVEVPSDEDLAATLEAAGAGDIQATADAIATEAAAALEDAMEGAQ